MEIRPLNDEEQSALADGLQLAARYVEGELPLSVEQVQILYDVIRDNDAGNVAAQIAVGLAFGEIIATKAGYEWVRVKDEYGEETALSPAGFQACCHPISILQKRIEKKETIKISELCDSVIETIDTRCASGEYALR